MKADRGLTIERMVELGLVSRSGFYRFHEESQAGPGRDRSPIFIETNAYTKCFIPSMPSTHIFTRAT